MPDRHPARASEETQAEEESSSSESSAEDGPDYGGDEPAAEVPDKAPADDTKQLNERFRRLNARDLEEESEHHGSEELAKESKSKESKKAKSSKEKEKKSRRSCSKDPRSRSKSPHRKDRDRRDRRDRSRSRTRTRRQERPVERHREHKRDRRDDKARKDGHREQATGSRLAAEKGQSASTVKLTPNSAAYPEPNRGQLLQCPVQECGVKKFTSQFSLAQHLWSKHSGHPEAVERSKHFYPRKGLKAQSKALTQGWGGSDSSGKEKRIEASSHAKSSDPNPKRGEQAGAFSTDVSEAMRVKLLGDLLEATNRLMGRRSPDP